MKHILSAFLLLALLWEQLPARAQNKVTINNPYGAQPVCPGRTYTYTAIPASGSSNCTYQWVQSAGVTLQDANNTNFAQMRVAWPDVTWSGNHEGTLQVVASNCSNTAGNTSSEVLRVYIRSITNKPIGPITVGGDLSFGSTGVLTLSIPRVEVVPADGNAVPPRVQEFAGGYTWTIPAGWQYVRGGGNITSNGGPQYFADATAYNMQVLPTAQGTSASLTVTAKDAVCDGQGSTGTVSAPAQLTVQRPLPTVRIISDRTPTGGNLTLGCGDRTDYHFRPGVSGVQPGGSLSYFWSTGGQMQTVCCANTATPVLVPSGQTGQGSINLQASYTRNGASAPVPVDGVVVTVQPQVATPTFTRSSPSVCPGQTVRFTVEAPGASEYEWTLPQGFSVPTSTGPSINVTPPANLYYGDYAISVVARNPAYGCQPS